MTENICMIRFLLLFPIVVLISLFVPGDALAGDPIRFPTMGAKAEQTATLLAIDDFCLPLKKNLCYYMSQPAVRKEAVLRPSLDDPGAPDQTYAVFYGDGTPRRWKIPYVVL